MSESTKSSSRVLDTSRISPTAHYTGYVWFKNGMSYPCLETKEGARLFNAMRPANRVGALFAGGLTLEKMLLQRHVVIDHLLRNAIASGQVCQVVEVAAGMSPRGVTFVREFAEIGLRYVEFDLPGMATRKRQTLEAAGMLHEGHHIVAGNALADSGVESLFEAVLPLLDTTKPVAIITEGLVNYFDRPTVVAMWDRFFRFVATFPGGRYLTDISVQDETNTYATARIFRRALSVFAKGEVHIHFEDAQAVENVLRRVGWSTATATLPEAFRGRLDIPITRHISPVRIVEAIA